MRRIGIDVGGTFTDVILVDDVTNEVWSAKVPTDPVTPVEGVIAGVLHILEVSGAPSEHVGFVGHGTTIATNLLVEGKGARTALITTKGFRDILEIRRSSRHDRADLYDLMYANPPPLVPRARRLEAHERVRADGKVERPLSNEEIGTLVTEVRQADVEAVAVCLINAHAHPGHERLIADALRAQLPEVFVTASHEVNPEISEYERTSTTVINAMLGPKCSHYISSLEGRLHSHGIGSDVQLMQSNGGLARPAVVAAKPVSLLESGPAGGVTAALKLSERIGIKNLILGDMGGTTFDVSLVRDGRAEMRTNHLLQTYAVRAPTIDIESIGAGGGSIAWIDEGGGVHVGPRSAGARPGPACYGHGGAHPTVTDCNLILGYLDPQSFLGGDFDLDVDAAHRVVEAELARPLGCSVVEAARVVRTISNTLMAQAIRLMTVERGYDPREFAYLCYGGAGPVHAVDLARELEIPKIVVPPLPGLFSAFGMLVADQSYDLQAPILRTVEDVSAEALATTFEDLFKQGRELFGNTVAEIEWRRQADCRYLGQVDLITVELPGNAAEVASPSMVRELFESAHTRHWNFVLPGTPVLLVNLRVVAAAKTGFPGLKQRNGHAVAAKPYRARRLQVDGAVEIPSYRREDLHAGSHIAGPAVIEEQRSSLFFGPLDRADIDAHGNIIVLVG